MRLLHRAFALCVIGSAAGILADDARPTTRPAATQPVTAPSAPSAATQPGKPAKPVMTVEPSATVSPAVKAQIDAIIKDLSSDNWKDRQSAQDKLVKFGPDAVADLRQLADRAEDEEVRTRASAALRQIDENALIGGSLITISLKDAKPQTIFDLLAKQAHCEFPTYPKNLWQAGAANGTISMNLERVDFWTAFKEACQKSGVYPQQFGNDPRMTLHQGSNPYWNGPSVVSGPFLIVANRIQRTNSVELTNPGNVQHDFSFSLSAFAEPKIKVIQSSYNVKVEKAEDEKGNSLAIDDRNSNGFNSGQQWMWNLQARLNYPENAGKLIARFRGSVKFLLQVQSETLDIPDVLTAKGVERRIAGRRILFKLARKQSDTAYEVLVTVFRDGMAVEDWNAMQYNANSIKLLDKDGRPLSSHGWGSSGDGTKMEYNWNFSRQNWGGEETKPGEPQRLVWEIPTETREMDVNFEFKDLPLP